MKTTKAITILFSSLIIFSVLVIVSLQKSRDSNDQLNIAQNDSGTLSKEAERLNNTRGQLLNIDEYKLDSNSNGFIYISKIYHPELKDINRIVFVGNDGRVGKLAQADFGNMFYTNNRLYTINDNGLEFVDINSGLVTTITNLGVKENESISNPFVYGGKWFYLAYPKDCVSDGPKDPDCVSRLIRYDPYLGVHNTISDNIKPAYIAGYDILTNSLGMVSGGYADQGCEWGRLWDFDLDTNLSSQEIKYDSCTEEGSMNLEKIFSRYYQPSTSQEYLEIKNGLVAGPVGTPFKEKMKGVLENDSVYYFQYYPF